MADFLTVADPILFLKYATPCGQVLVKRGKLDEDKLDKLIENVRFGRVGQADCEIFEVSMFWCSKIAKEAGKNDIDAETIRKYFLEEHDKVIEEMASSRPDIKPEMCKVQQGMVMGSDENGTLKVFLPTGTRHVRPDFVPRAKTGDTVTVHYNFACEVLK